MNTMFARRNTRSRWPGIMSLCLSLLLAVLVAGTCFAQLPFGKVRMLNGTVAAGEDRAEALVIDGLGSPVAAGKTSNTGSMGDFTIMKFSAQGNRNLLWSKVFPSTGFFFAGAGCVTADGQNNIFAGGYIDRTDFTVVKLNGTNGNQLWRKDIDGTSTLTYDNDWVFDLAVDKQNNLIAVGQIHNADTGLDFFVVKLSGVDGSEIWRKEIDGTATDEHAGDEAWSVALDSLGNVIAGGYIQNADTGQDFFVVKLNGSNGSEIWRKTVDGTADLEGYYSVEEAHSVVVDAQDSVIAGGVSENADTYIDFRVIKWSSAGVLQWDRAFTGDAEESRDRVEELALDSKGNVIAGGELEWADTGGDFTVIKLAANDGSELWRCELNGTQQLSTDGVISVAVDSKDKVYAAGGLYNEGTGSDFTVAKLSPNGALLNLYMMTGDSTYTGPNDYPRKVRVDKWDKAVTAGFLNYSTTGDNFTLAFCSK